MRDLIYNRLASTTTLDEAAEQLTLLLKILRSRPLNRIGYVAGILTSDGPDQIPENIKHLEIFTEEIRKMCDFPIFSTVDVFGRTNLWNQFEKEPSQSWIDFWRKIISSGLVTDLFLTPGWERSKGAKDEFETAKTNNLKIHQVSEDFVIKPLT